MPYSAKVGKLSVGEYS
uniref:Uncharacterized protein n=1 Tax=Anguilla anguilla TaxID=7936 RepID=A0A0E9UIN1_ANGAN